MILTFWQDKVRPLLDKHPGIALGIVGVGVVAALFFALPAMKGGGPPLADFSNYYTCDDGKTLFEDNDPHDIPHFPHMMDGEAVQAFFVPGKTPGRTDSIWYLTKMTDERKQLMEVMATGGGAAPCSQAWAQKPRRRPWADS